MAASENPYLNDDFFHEEDIGWNTPLADVPSDGSWRASGYTRAELEKIVEPPLRRICLELFDRGIRTLDSSACERNIGDHAGLAIRYETLSDTNQRYIRALAEKHPQLIEFWHSDELGWGEMVTLRVPIPNGNTTVQEVDAAMYAHTSGFTPQVATWIPRETIDEFFANRKDHMPDGTPEQRVSMYGQYYDPESQRVFPNEELFHLYNASLKFNEEPTQRIEHTSTELHDAAQDVTNSTENQE